MTRLRALNPTVEPVNVVAPKRVPLLERMIPVIPAVGLPVPESVIVKPVKVTGVLPGLLTRIWTTGKLAVPGSWLELGGMEGPEPTETVTGVAVGVAVAIWVGVLDGGTGEGVKVEVDVGLIVGVPVAGVAKFETGKVGATLIGLEQARGSIEKTEKKIAPKIPGINLVIRFMDFPKTSLIITLKF